MGAKETNNPTAREIGLRREKCRDGLFSFTNDNSTIHSKSLRTRISRL